MHSHCMHTYTRIRSQSARNHTHTKPHNTHTTTHTISLYPISHSVRNKHTLIAHIPSCARWECDPRFFSWFFKSFLQCWSRHWEDCSVIQEQYILRVWRREASRGLWLNTWYGINAPRHECRSSRQDHAHQESHVLRFNVVQCSSLCITHTWSHHLRMHSFAKDFTHIWMRFQIII